MSRLLILGLLLGLLGLAFADEGLQVEDVKWSEAEQSKLTLLKEVSELKSQIDILESNLKDAKRESVDKSRKIVSLEGEVANFQKQNAGDVELKLKTYEEKANEYAKQVKKLEELVKKLEETARDAGRRLDMADAKNVELSSKNLKLERRVADLRKKLRDAEEKLSIAEAAMLRAQSEAAAKAQELYKVYEAWLPPWVASRLARLQATSSTYWVSHGEPFLRQTAEQASQHAATAKAWAEPHVATFNEKIRPVIEEYWIKASAAASENSRVVRVKVREGYEAAMNHASPYISQVKEHVEPHIQKFKKSARPYVDEAAAHLRPLYEKVQVLVEPYTEKLREVYRVHVIKNHQQIQKAVKGLLVQHEVSAPLAARWEVVFFLTTMVMVLPAVFVAVLFSSLFGDRKPVKPNKGNRKHRKKPL